MIEHIVISGGGPTGFISYGCLKHLEQNGVYNINNIKSIYGTSIGGITAVLLGLKYEWNVIDDYIIKRPWEKVFTLKFENILDTFTNKGLFTFGLCNIFFKDLLEAKELNIDITLKEFYEYNKIDLHLFTVEMNEFKLVDLNHKDFPDLSLITALDMTTAFPIIFKPVFYKNKCFIDGGAITIYPLKECIENEKCDETSILGIKNVWEEAPENISEDLYLLEYLAVCTNIILNQLNKNYKNPSITNEVCCLCDSKLEDKSEWMNIFSEKEKRMELVQKGENDAKIFLNYVKQKDDNT